MATKQAFDLLEARMEGGYEQLISDILDCGGTLVQTPEFFLAFVVQDRVAYVPFACGNLRKILAFAHANKDLFGFDAVEWTRRICGKHSKIHRYSMKDLKR